MNDSPVMRSRQRPPAAPYPIFAFLGCECVKIDKNIPGQCLRAFPLFKPEVRIVVRRFDSGSYIDDGHGRLLDWDTSQAADSSERLGILILAILGSCFALSLSP